ncbi:hypothetical protein H2198_007891 [Neophaeococcomyces mojaviensis]|uniref:Uncharacterized protein n=1 Tax=Neophaeococcomyces mojaviensis TaxID=3383035 RepID=A0ACC2ZYS7_9EURO|nr:hypothetical protein H2198_007891 [Knufia sp. JES_112]
MDSSENPQKPVPAVQRQPSFSADDDATLKASSTQHQQQHHNNGDYDPCQNAKICSPFYMYNHDSPRPSQDLRQGKPSIHVDVRDLELGDITPSITQEKLAAQQQKVSLSTRLKFWDRERKQKCLTKPKKQWWLQRLPKKQRVMVKLLIAFLVAGAMVGIAVGIAAALHSGVYGTDKTVGSH